MSKAFTKDDTDAGPVVITPRAPLPEGTPNYVTARGLALLTQELQRLEQARAAMDDLDGADERRRRVAALSARASELALRIASAVLVEPRAPWPEEVRFGATVRVRGEDDHERTYDIVGIDEADAAQGRLAFVAPLSRALMGKRVGDVVTLRTPRGQDELEVLAISYERA